MLTWNHCQILVSHLVTISVALLFSGATKRIMFYFLWVSVLKHLYLTFFSSSCFCTTFLFNSIATTISKILIIVCAWHICQNFFFFVSLVSIILLHKFPFATDVGIYGYQFSAASVSNSLSTGRGICVQILSCLINYPLFATEEYPGIQWSMISSHLSHNQHLFIMSYFMIFLLN